MIGFHFEIALKLLMQNFPEKPMKKPTLYHSIRVGVSLWNHGYDEDLQIAGLLHDALEDTSMEEELILHNFGKEVLDIVKANSKNKNLPKDEILEGIVKRCRETGERAMIVKMADIYDNFLFYTKEKNSQELERCKKLANLVKKYKKESWGDTI
ncbi:HD domain-containing protein, partial [Candidatus Gracilibacteria bacterium]|nr:HD domain-containing protein [Candidatus Gracilibacteria bacterium]